MGVGLSREVSLVCRDGQGRGGFSDERKYLCKRRVCLWKGELRGFKV